MMGRRRRIDNSVVPPNTADSHRRNAVAFYFNAVQCSMNPHAKPPMKISREKENEYFINFNCLHYAIIVIKKKKTKGGKMATAVVISGTSTFRNLLGNDGCGVGRRNGCSVCKNSVKERNIKKRVIRRDALLLRVKGMTCVSRESSRRWKRIEIYKRTKYLVFHQKKDERLLRWGGLFLLFVSV